MKSVKLLTISALLIAIGIAIPLFMPIKVQIEPMSWTLCSHVPIFIAAFISPIVAVAVALGTALGFQLAGFPMSVVARATTHIAFALVLAIFWHKLSQKNFLVKNVMTNIVIALIHAICEAMVVLLFFAPPADTARIIWLLVFVGTIVHSIVDFEISYILWDRIKWNKTKKKN